MKNHGIYIHHILVFTSHTFFSKNTIFHAGPLFVAWRTELPTDGFARRRHGGDFIEARGFLGNVLRAIQGRHLTAAAAAWYGATGRTEKIPKNYPY